MLFRQFAGRRNLEAPAAGDEFSRFMMLLGAFLQEPRVGMPPGLSPKTRSNVSLLILYLVPLLRTENMDSKTSNKERVAAASNMGDADVGLECDRAGLGSRPFTSCRIRHSAGPRSDWPATLRDLRNRGLCK